MNKPIPEDLKSRHDDIAEAISEHESTAEEDEIYHLHKRIGRLEEERNQLRLTRIKDGQTISKLQEENASLKSILIEASELVEPDSCGVDKSEVSLDVLKCLPEGIRALKAREKLLRNALQDLLDYIDMRYHRWMSEDRKKYVDLLAQFDAEENQ